MPELPEAETIARGLRRAVVGQVVGRVDVLRPDVLRQGARHFRTSLRGRRIDRVGRRGKNVVLDLDDRSVIAVNLGMTGRLLPFSRSPRRAARPTHPAVRFRFEDGGLLVFDDTRRFGTVEHLSAEGWAERSARMGPEPLAPGFGARQLLSGLRASRTPIRSWLLDQRRLAGVGNIYANEALFLAGVHPQTRACDVGTAAAGRLHRSIRRVLREAIEAGGTTIRDYRDAGGEEGRYARRLHVYGRAGQPCVRCRSPIRRVVFGNRSAFHCPRCQPRS